MIVHKTLESDWKGGQASFLVSQAMPSTEKEQKSVLFKTTQALPCAPSGCRGEAGLGVRVGPDTKLWSVKHARFHNQFVISDHSTIDFYYCRYTMLKRWTSISDFWVGVAGRYAWPILKIACFPLLIWVAISDSRDEILYAMCWNLR